MKEFIDFNLFKAASIYDAVLIFKSKLQKTKTLVEKFLVDNDDDYEF